MAFVIFFFVMFGVGRVCFDPGHKATRVYPHQAPSSAYGRTRYLHARNRSARGRWESGYFFDGDSGGSTFDNF